MSPTKDNTLRATTVQADFRTPGTNGLRTREQRWTYWLAGLLVVGLIGVQSASAFASTCRHTACTRGSCDQPEEGVDLDRDGVPDRLEYDLAHRFFPRIKLQISSADLRQSYLFHDRALPYMVRPLPPVPNSPCAEAYKCLEIRYGMAYFRDTGDIGGISSHLGDSEFYAALVHRDQFYTTAQTAAHHWRLLRDYTAAHQGERFFDSSKVGAYGFCPTTSCSSYSPTECRQHATRCAVTRISIASLCVDREEWSCYALSRRYAYNTLYASEGKHALYHSVGECDDGALHFDSCDHNAYDMRDYKDTHLLQNIGRAPRTFNISDLTTFDHTIQHPSCGAYNVWSGQDFGGAGDYRSKFLADIPWVLN